MKPTIEQILNEPDGRQMDEWVAEFVMGWEVLSGFSPLSFRKSNGVLITHDLTSFGSFKPSEDIAAAWEVVEKMREKGFGFVLEDDCLPEEFTATFLVDGDPLHEIYGHADTAPLAICRAALLAVLKGDRE